MHSAASLAIPASKEAARLLRAAEGLVRAATAVLQASQAPQEGGVRRGSSQGHGGDQNEHKDVGNDKDKSKGKRGKSRAGNRGDWQCKACGAHCFGSKAACFKCGVVRRGADDMAVEEAVLPDDDGLDDYWAEGGGDGVASVVSTEGASCAPGARRQLVARGSRERSPRGRNDCAPGIIIVGTCVKLQGLTSRLELNGLSGVVVEVPTRGGGELWFGVQLVGMVEQIRVKRSNLSLFVAKPSLSGKSAAMSGSE